MASITASTEVGVPVRTAYDQWTQFETFPDFMEGVREVRQLDDTRLHWVAEIGGQEEEWDAEITQQEPDMRVAWCSTTGTHNAGVVTFHRLEDALTRVTLQMEWDPDGTLQQLGALLGFDDRRAQGDLQRFKEFIEGRGQATGAWRGRVVQDAVTGTSELTGASGLGDTTGAEPLEAPQQRDAVASAPTGR